MKKVNYTPSEQLSLLTKLAEHYGDTVLTNKQVLAYTNERKMPYPTFLLAPARQVSWGKYSVALDFVKESSPKPKSASPAPSPAVSADTVDMSAQVITMAPKRAANITENFIPTKDPTYVAFGFHNDLKKIIESKVFYPIYITGLSGNGKTKMVEQVCSQLKREFVRVNITKQTDETDLIGSYELIDGNTVRREGPVITAMRRGAVLLIDEVDLGTELLLCLQPILEGNPFFDKKTGEMIYPSAGFTIIATANTKGKGSDDGRFIGTNVLNEAFLERFGITVEQEYPSPAVETKILEKNFESLGVKDDGFIKCLVTWSEVIRKAYYDDAVDELISTRRLVHLAKAYSIFKDRKKAITMCLNRFDSETKTAFLDLYTKVDADVASANVSANTQEHVATEQLPQSSIEYHVLAQTVQNAKKVPVSVVNMANEGCVRVYSHGMYTNVNYSEMDVALNATSDIVRRVVAIVESHENLRKQQAVK